MGYDELRLTNLETRQEIVGDFQVQFCGGLGARGLEGYFWSTNSRYFYYTNAREGVPDGCGFWGKPYWVFDTKTSIKTLLGGGAVSPNKSLVAVWGKKEIVIWDFNEGEIARSPVEEADLVRGPIAWSPDGLSLVYLQTTSWCPPEDSVLTRLDAPAFKASFERKLLYGDFIGVHWESDDELRLTDFQSIEWRYVLRTNRLEPLTFTPRPPSQDLKQFVSDKYLFSFRYPTKWITDCCGLGSAPPGAEHLITIADPKTVRFNTGAPFDGFAVYVDENVAQLSFQDYIAQEKERMTAIRLRFIPPVMPTSSPDIRVAPQTQGTEREYVFGGWNGVLLKGYLNISESYIYVPLHNSNIMIVIANLQYKLRWDNELENIFATFKFE